LDEFLKFLNNLGQAITYEQFGEAMAQAVTAFGFDSYTYCGLRPTAAMRGNVTKQEDMKDGYLYISNMREQWQRRYMEQAHWDNDPVMRYCMASTMPITWDQNFAVSRRTAAEDRMMEDAAAYGVIQGISVATHGPGAEIGILSLYSSVPAKEFSRLAAMRVHQVHLMAIHLHYAMQETFGVKEGAPVVLTKRENEVMLWTAEGKTAWEIASILKCTERTVNAHVKNIMNKMGVFSKTHAVSKFLTGYGG
jgi:DNA-binding CsgD family transcriptional regulator